ncbi:hypothetical protein WJX74_008751 [Apatococcus lobatus]|uniref:Uncharacterized protein n=1 Tax=Apatococcus lobatus TaxID=904363 RepID=A0AAW1Q7B5_9CHLO
MLQHRRPMEAPHPSGPVKGSPCLVSEDGTLRSSDTQAAHERPAEAFVPACGLQQRHTCLHNNCAELHVDKASHVPGRRAVLLHHDGTFAAQICKAETLKAPLHPVSLVDLMSPANGQPGSCHDTFRIRCHDGSCYQATRSYPTLQGSIARILPGGASQHYADVLAVSTAEAPPSAKNGSQEVSSRQELQICLHTAASHFQLSFFAMTAAIMKESTFAPHLKVSSAPPFTMPEAMQANLKHYANMNHLPPGEYLKADSGDQHRFKAAEATGMALLLKRNFAHLGAQLLKLLDQVNDRPYLYGKPGASVAVHRYERCWLPLLLAHGRSGQQLCPPLDVAWVWFVHAICPQRYAEDILASTGVAAQSFCSHPVIRTEASLLGAQKLWRVMFPEEPFDLDEAAVPSRYAHLQAESPASGFKYKIADAVDRQQAFWYQVSLPHYRDEQFLRAADRNYRQFLLLHQQNPGNFIVPSFDMDLLWHAHQACHAMYLEDCRAAFGKLFGHDDSINDRAPGLQLENGFQRTARLYAQTFGRPYTFAGGMWRGPAPPASMGPAPVRAQANGKASHRCSNQGQGNAGGPSVDVLQDFTNILQDPQRPIQAQGSGMQKGLDGNNQHLPGKATQAGRLKHKQNTDSSSHIPRQGFLQRVSRLWRGSQTSSSKNASREEMQERLQEPTGRLAHEFNVTPAAARDLSGDALGHEGGHVILPCYEADQALPDPVCHCFQVRPEGAGGTLMEVTLQHQGLASRTASVAVSTPQTSTASTCLEAAAWMVGTESLPVNWASHSVSYPALTPGQSAFLITAARQDWGLCIAEWVDPPDSPAGTPTSGAQDVGQLQATIHRLGAGTSSVGPYVMHTRHTPAGQVWEVSAGPPNAPHPQILLRVHLGVHAQVELADGVEQGPWLALAFVLSLQATLLGLTVDGYLHPGYLAGFMAVPGLALPMPVLGPSPSVSAPSIEQSGPMVAEPSDMSHPPPAGQETASRSWPREAASCAHLDSNQHQQHITGICSPVDAEHASNTMPSHYEDLVKVGGEPQHPSPYETFMSQGAGCQPAAESETSGEPKEELTPPADASTLGSSQGSQAVVYQPVAGCPPGRQLYLPSRANGLSHQCFRAQMLQQ